MRNIFIKINIAYNSRYIYKCQVQGCSSGLSLFVQVHFFFFLSLSFPSSDVDDVRTYIHNYTSSDSTIRPLDGAQIVRDELPEIARGFEYALGTRVSNNNKSLYFVIDITAML